MKAWFVVAACIGVLAIPVAAQARALSPYLAETYIRSDGRKLAKSYPWAVTTELGKCARPTLGLYECQAQIEGKRPIGYTYERGPEYEAGFCSWVGVAHYRGRYLIVVNRRELGCETWVEYSR